MFSPLDYNQAKVLVEGMIDMNHAIQRLSILVDILSQNSPHVKHKVAKELTDKVDKDMKETMIKFKAVFER